MHSGNFKKSFFCTNFPMNRACPWVVVPKFRQGSSYHFNIFPSAFYRPRGLATSIIVLYSSTTVAPQLADSCRMLLVSPYGVCRLHRRKSVTIINTVRCNILCCTATVGSRTRLLPRTTFKVLRRRSTIGICPTLIWLAFSPCRCHVQPWLHRGKTPSTTFDGFISSHRYEHVCVRQ